MPKQPVEGGSSQPHTTEGTRGDLGVGGGGKAPSASQQKGKPLSASEWRNPSASPPSPQRGAALPVFRQLCSSGCSSPGLYPALSSVNGICSSQRHLISPPGHKAQVRLWAGCLSSSRKAGDGQCATKLISAVLHEQCLQCTLGQAEGVNAATSALWAIGFGTSVLVLGTLKLDLLCHQITVHKRSEELGSSHVPAGKAGMFSTL